MLALLLCALLALHADALDVRVPESPAVALFGTDAVLNCSFSGVSEFNLSDVSVFWQLSDTQRTVHSFWQSRDQLIDQEERFSNRTSLFPDQLPAGNASLLLRRVRVSDEGSYSCFVRVQTYGRGAMLMQVAAPFSKPLVTWGPESALKPGDAVALSCEAFGGYPEAQVLWQDGAGRNLTDNVTISQVANEDGLFSVKSILTVILEPNSTYSCRLIHPLLGEEGQASVTISAQGLVFPPLALWLTVALAVCLLALLVALAVVCCRKIRESCEEMRAEEEAKELEEAKEFEEAKSGQGWTIGD
ncbi:CD276 antigen-like isoform X2 [Carassius carassius]|uniref:CD276 antigen-like isoform X2 n=1 Tax=Carassius carassius TaxID=217509 RepID=UPI0028685FE9|nr:CD276 antigen-like isoform X2 [Carassius carassius]